MTKKQLSVNAAIVLIAFSVIVCGFRLFCVMEQRFSDIKSELGLNDGVSISPISDTTPKGWQQECIETKQIERYELVEPLKGANSVYNYCIDSICYDVQSCIDHFSNTNNLDDVPFCFQQARCILKCTEENDNKKPYLNFWNETVCVKYTLVKEVDVV